MIPIRYAIISDIHANLEALSAVLVAGETLGVGQVVCLGDIVGYNANPAECIDILRRRQVRCIRGNHDAAAAASGPMPELGRTARRAIEWTRRKLSPENRLYLAELPTVLAIDELFLTVHGALHPQPNDTQRLTTPQRAEESFCVLLTRFIGIPLCFFGHTHRPTAYAYRHGQAVAIHGPCFALDDREHYLVNPGSVGRPLDGDQRASFAIFDSHTQTIEFHRVGYDRAAAFAKADAAGLIYRPGLFVRSKDWLWDRLEPRRKRGEGRSSQTTETARV